MNHDFSILVFIYLCWICIILSSVLWHWLWVICGIYIVRLVLFFHCDNFSVNWWTKLSLMILNGISLTYIKVISIVISISISVSICVCIICICIIVAVAIYNIVDTILIWDLFAVRIVCLWHCHILLVHNLRLDFV